MEEIKVASNPFLDYRDRLSAATLGIGLGLAATPKTVFQLMKGAPGIMEIIDNYYKSSRGVTNWPSQHNH